MPRARTGSVVWDEGAKRWKGRITVADGRPWIPCPPEFPRNERGEQRAREWIAEKSEIAKREGLNVADFGIEPRRTKLPEAPKGEDWNAWHARYLEVHERLGKSTRDMRGAARKWVGDRLGATPMLAIRREDIIGVRDAMTAAVLAEEISAKRAMNLWSDLVTSPHSRAFTDDDPRYSSVRVGPASANPATNVKPPVTKEQLDADRRDRQPIYPHEFAKLVACREISIEARRIYVLATYLYLRPQELYALRWTDIDWAAREVRIRRKLDVRTGEEKPGTKSDAGVREVPIHENLLPLLRAMHDEREGDDSRIIPLIGAARLFERFADQTRRHIKLAGIERTELVDGSADLLPFDFRSFRTTGCTWLAMLGTDSYVIALQAGHKSPDTTWGSYIKRGPDLRQRYGEPFAPVPAELLAPTESSGESSGGSGGRVFCGESSGEGGIRTRGRVLARRPLSKRVPSATRSPLLSGDGRSTAPFPTAQLRRSIDLDFVPEGRCRRGALGLYFAARRTTQAVMPPMPSISLNPVFPGPPASEAPSLVTMASGRRMFGWSCSGFTVVG